MTAENILKVSPEGGLLPDVTTEEFSVVRQEGNEQVLRELEEDSVIRNFRITATDGKRDLPKPVLIVGKDGYDA